MPSTLGIIAGSFNHTLNPLFRSVATQASIASTTTTIVQSKPSGLQDGDYMIATVITQNTVTPPVVGGNVWNLLISSVGGSYKVYGKVASGEPATSTWTSSGGTTGRWNVHTECFSQCSGVNISGSFRPSTSSKNMVWPSLTTTVPNTWAVHICFQITAVTFLNPSPADAVTRVVDTGTSGARGIISGEIGPAAAGVYPSKSNGDTTTTNVQWDCVLLMLKP